MQWHSETLGLNSECQCEPAMYCVRMCTCRLFGLPMRTETWPAMSAHGAMTGPRHGADVTSAARGARLREDTRDSRSGADAQKAPWPGTMDNQGGSKDWSPRGGNGLCQEWRGYISYGFMPQSATACSFNWKWAQRHGQTRRDYDPPVIEQTEHCIAFLEKKYLSALHTETHICMCIEKSGRYKPTTTLSRVKDKW